MANNNEAISIKSIGITICVLFAAYYAWSTATETSQLEKEQRLIFIGNQYRSAISRYYENSPGTTKQFPRRLEDLLEDARTISKNRYIAQLYPDPITEKAWGLLRTLDGSITGIHSLSEDAPVKHSDFDLDNQSFAGKSKHSDWLFQYVPKQITQVARPRDEIQKQETAVREEKSDGVPSPMADDKNIQPQIVSAVSKPPSRTIPPLATQIDLAAIQMGSGVPDIPPLVNESNHHRRICIVNSTRYASACAHQPDNAVSKDAVLSCVVEAQQRYEQCNGV